MKKAILFLAFTFLACNNINKAEYAQQFAYTGKPSGWCPIITKIYSCDNFGYSFLVAENFKLANFYTSTWYITDATVTKYIMMRCDHHLFDK